MSPQGEAMGWGGDGFFSLKACRGMRKHFTSRSLPAFPPPPPPSKPTPNVDLKRWWPGKALDVGARRPGSKSPSQTPGALSPHRHIGASPVPK